MLHLIPNGEEITCHANSAFGIYGKKVGNKIIGGAHYNPEPYGAWYNKHSTKSGYHEIQIDRNGTFDDVQTDYGGTNYEYRSTYDNCCQPKQPTHGTHQTALANVIWYKCSVKTTLSQSDMQTWYREVRDNYPNCDLSQAPNPVIEQKSNVKPTRFYFNDFNSKSISY
jgi:hypothetical protein